MNSATAKTKPRAATSKRSAPPDPITIATKKISFDDLHHRWERIVSGDRA